MNALLIELNFLINTQGYLKMYPVRHQIAALVNCNISRVIVAKQWLLKMSEHVE